jgi:GAF domain-containing protein
VQLVRLCAELARIVLSDPLGLVLQQIADLAVEAIPEAEEVSVTLMERGKARSVVFTGNLAAGLDERQYRDGFGPCMDAAMTGETITIEDTAHSSTYPAFGRQAHRHGVNHTLSVGMATSPQAAGAINIYSTTPSGPFAPASRDSAAAFASYAAIALVNVATVSAATTEAGQLRQAMASRASIEQAKGILMRDRHCSADEAFAILRDYSSRSNRKLHDIVQDILDDAS